MKAKIFAQIWTTFLLLNLSGQAVSGENFKNLHSAIRYEKINMPDKAVTSTKPRSISDPQHLYDMAMQLLGNEELSDKDFAEGFKWLKLAAALQYDEALYALGFYHHLGIDNVPVNYHKAVSIYQQAARQGHLVAQFQLSNLLLDEALPVYNPQQAIYWLTKAAQQNDTMSQYSLAILYHDMSPRTGKNITKYHEWLTYAAENGYRQAQYVLASFYLEATEQPDHLEKARYWFHQAALQGDADSQYNLALLYEEQEQTPENQQQAIYWFSQASEQNMPDAQFNLGRKYLFSLGTEQDITQGLQLISAAAEGNNPAAQTLLASFYLEGEYLQQDYSKALKLYKLAADSQFAEAQYRLALMFAKGQGVEKSEKEAVYWIRKAAELDHPYAQYGLGAYLINGVGIEKNMFLAAYWISRAAAQGQEHAIKAKQSVLRNLTETQQKNLLNLLNEVSVK